MGRGGGGGKGGSQKPNLCLSRPRAAAAHLHELINELVPCHSILQQRQGIGATGNCLEFWGTKGVSREGNSAVSTHQNPPVPFVTMLTLRAILQHRNLCLIAFSIAPVNAAVLQ